MTSDSLKVSTLQQGVNPPKQPPTGEDLIALLEFKYASKPCSQHIFVKELEVNLIGNVSNNKYTRLHSGSSR